MNIFLHVQLLLISGVSQGSVLKIVLFLLRNDITTKLIFEVRCICLPMTRAAPILLSQFFPPIFLSSNSFFFFLTHFSQNFARKFPICSHYSNLRNMCDSFLSILSPMTALLEYLDRYNDNKQL